MKRRAIPLHGVGATGGVTIEPQIVGGIHDSITGYEPWMRDAACIEVDPEIFYPERGESSGTKAAKLICRHCPIQNDCLQHAVAKHESFGVWGGLTPVERRHHTRKAKP